MSFKQAKKNSINPLNRAVSGLSQPTRAFKAGGQGSLPQASPQPVMQLCEEKKDNTTRGRLQRAHKRAIRREEKSKSPKLRFPKHASEYSREFSLSREKKEKCLREMKTPFGPVNLSPFPLSDPGAKITTVKSEYGGTSVGHRYNELIKALEIQGVNDPDIARELLQSIKRKRHPPKDLKAITEDRQRNAAAKLLTIPHVSEELRFKGSSKSFRAVLRMVEKGMVSLEDAFTGDTPLFPMAKNPNYMRRLVNPKKKKLRKKTQEPKLWKKVGANMSASSEDESSSSEDED